MLEVKTTDQCGRMTTSIVAKRSLKPENYHVVNSSKTKRDRAVVKAKFHYI